MKILHVEDNEMNRRIFKYMLKMVVKEEYELIEAHDGQSGIDVFTQHQDFDIVFSDIRMPVVDGIEMCHEIRKIDKDVRIIFISAELRYEASDGIRKIINAEFIEKPVSKDVMDMLFNGGDE